MRRSRWPKISLSAKCRLLFGVAVLLILSATLLLPWVHMDSLSDAADIDVAQQRTRLAWRTADLDILDWKAAKAELERAWPDTARALGIAGGPPDLISVEQRPILAELGSSGFLHEAFLRFEKDPGLPFVHKFESDEHGQWVRFATAVRHAETDPQPNKLRGIIHVRVPSHTEDRHWSLIVLVLAGLSGCLLAMLVFYLVTQRLILSPVRDLRHVAEQVTEGRMAVRADIATGDEFEDLATAFNAMLERLQKSHEELRLINRSLDVKLGELAETNVALYEANKLKSQFIANVSHELRTPLGLIINFAELLRDALEDPPQDQTRVLRYAQNILKSGRALLDIINDLLDLAKIEAGKVELHLSEFSLAETGLALIDFMRPLADKKQIQLQPPSADGLPALHSDAGRVKQILYNLLSNAIKFTPDGGSVRLDVGRGVDGFVWLSVTDTGPGIPSDKFSLIFEKFRQIDSSLTREHSGTGLGLAITKELVNMLGGSITVESELGKGSVFTVNLPIVAPAHPTIRKPALND